MLRRLVSAAAVTATVLSTINMNTYSADDPAQSDSPNGWLLWHSYSDYSSLDSKLYIKGPSGEINEITGDFIHPMNGRFGTDPDQIIFMAIDPQADEWDIYLSSEGNIINLTEKSGFRNEDPKWSPDGSTVVFKRGHWDSDTNGFIYDLALMDIQTREINMLTDSNEEEAMPCYSADGKYIYFASYASGIGAIKQIDLDSHVIETIFDEIGVNAYYPVTKDTNLFFTKWYSEDNHHDQIMIFDNSKAEYMPFDSYSYDCSDACPTKDGKMIFSCTMNGSYDLFYFDGNVTVPLSELNSEKNELGADFFPILNESKDKYLKGDVNADNSFTVADLVLLQKWLLNFPDANLRSWTSGDLCNDEKLDFFDLCMMRKELIQKNSRGTSYGV